MRSFSTTTIRLGRVARFDRSRHRKLPTPNLQFPTTSNSQLPKKGDRFDHFLALPEFWRWALGVVGHWELGVGRWKFGLQIPRTRSRAVVEPMGEEIRRTPANVGT